MLFAYLNGFLHNMNGNSTFDGINNPGGDNIVIILVFTTYSILIAKIFKSTILR